MLEPRWRKEWLRKPDVRFLGGTDKFDFWHSTRRNTVRFVDSDKLGRWESYSVSLLPYLSADVAKSESQEDVDAAIAYLKLFAPYLFRERPKQ
jgi:hypothetical protein